MLASLCAIVAAWWWLAAPVDLVRAPIDPNAKLQCISYSPFRNVQTSTAATPVSREQLVEDFAHLAPITDCVRTYADDLGLDQVPEVAAKAGLKVIQGIWLSKDRQKNTTQIATAIRLAQQYPDTIIALVVGNEILLHREMTVSDLAGLIRSVKAQVSVPVTYSDVWEYWLRYRELESAVDFITIHILPYWENIPIPAKSAAAHVDAVRKQVAAAFPGKEILIGETGWPSEGRMRESALPSRTNQARMISEVLDMARREHFRVNLFEAYDELWKHEFEGAVGASWGVFDSDGRTLKYPPGVPVSNYPHWKVQMGAGLALAIAVFAVAWLSLRRRPWQPRLVSWIAVALSATIAGILFGVAAQKVVHESYGLTSGLQWCTLLAMATLSPLFGANALMAERAPAAFVELLGPPENRTQSLLATLHGLVFAIIIVIGTQTALGFVFDPREKNFPFASLTMAAIPFVAMALLNRPNKGRRPLAESIFTGIFVIAAIYMGFAEGPQNWQSLWTCATYLLLAITLWRARA